MLRISASQIKAYKQCKPKYAWEYVHKIKSPSTPVQAFGTATHKQLEEWLKTSTPPTDTPEGRTALQGIEAGHLPIPQPGLLVEKELKIDLSLDLILIGYIDLVIPPSINPVPTVIDHKTTSSLRWAMTQEQLATDPQAIIYVTWAMLEYGLPEVIARWIYYAASKSNSGGVRRPSGTRVVEHKFSAKNESFLLQLDEIEDTVEEMKLIRDSKTAPGDLEPNLDACGMYGGCFHRGRCANLFKLNKKDSFSIEAINEACAEYNKGNK